MSTEVLEEHFTCRLLHSGFLLGLYLILKIEVTCSSETSFGFQRATLSYTPGDKTLHNHCCEILKFCTMNAYFRWVTLNYLPPCRCVVILLIYSWSWALLEEPPIYDNMHVQTHFRNPNDIRSCCLDVRLEQPAVSRLIHFEIDSTKEER
jgi:hypothetical protein